GIRDKLVTGVQTCALPILPRATVAWRLPTNPTQVFRRFRTYSQHTLKADLGTGWQFAVAKMYLIGLLYVAAKVLSGWIEWFMLRSEERRVGKECRAQGRR